MSKYDELFDRLLTIEDAEFGPPTQRENIELFEQKSGVILPESYKAFLIRFGGLTVLSEEVIAGIEGEYFNILSITQRLQKQWEMPGNLLVLQPDDEAPYCFDLAMPQANGEYVIVCYELGKSYSKIANDFPKWFEEFVLFVYENSNETDS